MDRKLIAARIDRDFPHQILLPLYLDVPIEEELIDWLDRRIGRWDMYVDLGDRFIRYCFFDERDAQAFRARFAPSGQKVAS